MKYVFSVYDAKTNFSKLLRIVKANHEVIITDRGQPVARLVAETSAALAEDPLEARLDELEAHSRKKERDTLETSQKGQVSRGS